MIKTSKSGISIMRNGVVETESDDASKSVFLTNVGFLIKVYKTQRNS